MTTDWNKTEILYQTQSFINHYLRIAPTEKARQEWEKKLADNQKEIDRICPKSWQKTA